MISNRRSSLTNLTRNFDVGKWKLIFDNHHNETKDNVKNKKAVKMDEREAAYITEVKSQVTPLFLWLS